MENVYYGVPVFLFTLIGYSFAFKYCKQQEYGKALSLLIICGLALRLYTSMDFYLHAWDERYHALVAKNMLKHFFKPTLYENAILPYDYKSWISNHIWLHKQPLTLWLIAASLKIFGLHEWTVRIPSVILSCIAIKLIYDIGKYFTNSRIAFFAAFLYSIHGLIIELSAGRDATDHVDITFSFFILLAVWFSVKYVEERRRYFNVLTGISIGLAILSKWLPALVVLPIWLLLVVDAKTDNARQIVINFVIILMSISLIAMPWQIYIMHAFPAEAFWEYKFNSRHIYESLEGQGDSVFYYLNDLRMKYGEFIYLPMCWYVYKVFRQRQLKDIAIFCWFIIPYLFFSFVATKMPAYTLFTAPAIFLITASCYYEIIDYVKSNKSYRLIFWVIAFGLWVLPLRYSIERIKPFSRLDRNPGWARSLKQLRNTSIDSERVILFNCPNPIEAMFYLSCTCYASATNPELTRRLEASGYKVFIYHPR